MFNDAYDTFSLFRESPIEKQIQGKFPKGAKTRHTCHGTEGAGRFGRTCRSSTNARST